MEENKLYTVSAQDARVQLSEMINKAVYASQPSLITRQGKPVAVLVGYAQWQALLQPKLTSIEPAVGEPVRAEINELPTIRSEYE